MISMDLCNTENRKNGREKKCDQIKMQKQEYFH